MRFSRSIRARTLGRGILFVFEIEILCSLNEVSLLSKITDSIRSEIEVVLVRHERFPYKGEHEFPFELRNDMVSAEFTRDNTV